MMHRSEIRLLYVLALIFLLAGCNMPGFASQLLPGSGDATDDLSLAASMPPLSETLISFRVQVPPNTPDDGTVFLNVLDEVTGMALNAQLHPMQPAEPATQPARVYSVDLPFAIGSVIKYRYERQVGALRVTEHLSDGSPVHYRLYYVQGQNSVEDIINRWTDTPFDALSGRITGQATDADSGQPLPNLLVAAGGAQAITASDGTFRLESLSEGVHNLVGYAMDGAYIPFEQGARVASQSTTPATLKLKAASLTKLVFVVSVPQETPPVVPLRLAGSLYQLGNSFGSLQGGMSMVTGNMPVLNRLPDGRYTVTINLPTGADVRYKYTLGDGFWNAEHDTDGNPVLRQIIVPEETTLVEDKVETWYAGAQNSLTFDVHVPADTPPQDFVAIQFNPLFGWTEPIPMWHLGGDRWAYVLYSPLNLPGSFSYRYCRNGQCGFADDAQTAGVTGTGRTVQLGAEPQILEDTVTAWANWSGSAEAVIPEVVAEARGAEFWAGTEFIPAYHPSWKALLPTTLDQVSQLGGNRIVFSPTWTFVRGTEPNDLPVLQLVPGQDPQWFDLVDGLKKAQERGLKTALDPAANFPMPAIEWWASARRDAAWWQVWFEQYSGFVIHHADLAQQNGASALIIGGEWVAPALPGGTLADGTPSGVPEDAEARWRSILQEVDNHFDGDLLWALPHKAAEAPPPFLDEVDQIYIELTLTTGLGIESELGSDPGSWLDFTVWTFQILENKPLILGVEYPSFPDLQAQVDAYQALLSAASQRDWISGFVTRGFYPPAALQGTGPSVHGKPASELLGIWYPQLLK